jgi:hypothetical protein
MEMRHKETQKKLILKKDRKQEVNKRIVYSTSQGMYDIKKKVSWWFSYLIISQYLTDCVDGMIDR